MAIYMYVVPTEKQWSEARWVIEQYLAYLEAKEPGAIIPIGACQQLLGDMGGPVEEAFGG